MIKPDTSIIATLREATGVVDDINENDVGDFDAELGLFFNTVMGELSQVGIGDSSFMLLDATSNWTDWLGEEATNSEVYALATSYTVMRVRLLFDPPQPATITYMSALLDTMIQRLRIAGDSIANKEDGGEEDGA